MHKRFGAVYWLTGLPGSGKSTLGQQLQAYLKEHKARSCVYLDGDRIREVLGRQEHYRPEDRLQLAYTYGRFCFMLAQQNLDVVCATVSLFHEVQAWNRQHIPRYHEICIQVPLGSAARTRPKKNYILRALQAMSKTFPDWISKWNGPKRPMFCLTTMANAILSRYFKNS